MIICGIEGLRGLEPPVAPFWEGVFYTGRHPPPHLRKLFTKTVDNAVENDWESVAHRSVY
jgi:hypothetical protein